VALCLSICMCMCMCVCVGLSVLCFHLCLCVFQFLSLVCPRALQLQLEGALLSLHAKLNLRGTAPTGRWDFACQLLQWANSYAL